jgi:hypothetical protein
MTRFQPMKLLGAATAVTSAPSVVPATTSIQTDAAAGIFRLERGDNLAQLIFALQGGDGYEAKARIFQERDVLSVAGGNPEALPLFIAELDLTAGSQNGAGDVLDDSTDYLADTIEASSDPGNSTKQVDVVSPANNLIGHVTVDPRGGAIIVALWCATHGGSNAATAAMVAATTL